MIVRHRAPFTFDRSFDRAFDELTSSLFETRRRLPEVHGAWDGETFVLTVDLPGVSADAVSVDVSGRLLTLGAHTDQLDWSRQVNLGTSLDPEKITARHLDGRLTVRIGAVDEPASRSIAIDTEPERLDAPTPDAIETGDTSDDATTTTSG